MQEGLFSLPGTLKIYRTFGGFPVDVDPCDPNGQASSDRILLVRPLLLVAVLFSATLAISMAQMEALFGGVFAFQVLADAMGVPKEDAMLPLVFYCINWCVSACFLALYVYSRRKIVKVYKDLASINCRVFHPTSKKVRSMNKLWMSCYFFMYILVMGAGICYSVLIYATFSAKSDEPISVLGWASTLTYGMGASLSAANPLIGSGVISFCDILVVLADICVQWENKIKDLVTMTPQHGSAHKTLNRTKLLLSQLSIGDDFCELINFAKKTFSPFTVAMYAYFLAGGVLYTYGGFGLLLSSSEGLIPFLLCMGALMIAVIFVQTIWILSFVGSYFTEKRNAARAMLSHLLCNAYLDIDDQVKYQAQELLDRLTQANMSPYDYFEISNSNFLAMIATNVTYIIVLLQFKTTLPPDGSDVNVIPGNSSIQIPII